MARRLALNPDSGPTFRAGCLFSGHRLKPQSPQGMTTEIMTMSFALHHSLLALVLGLPSPLAPGAWQSF